MITIIKNVNVYEPAPLGALDILVAGGKIIQIEKNIELGVGMTGRIIDGSGLLAVPGFIDSHEHITGGGGEGGYATRTPEATLSGLAMNGVTTVVGCLGTDGITRSMQNLVAKAHGLDEEGITTYIYTGSYQVPVKTVTSNVMEDLLMLDKVIGVGEIAMSDHRSSQPAYEELARIAAEARVGGMLSGKAGIVNVHIGDSPRCMDLIEQVVANTEIPITQFLPTHVNRNAKLFERALAYAKEGGTIDFTGNEDIDYWETICDEVRVCIGVKRMLEEGISSELFTISSDGQGSLPMFNERQEFIGLGIGKASCLLKEVKECVTREDIPLEIAIKGITSNVARILKLPHKGQLKTGFDADICLLKEDTLDIDTVMARGKILVEKGRSVAFGTFEGN